MIFPGFFENEEIHFLKNKRTDIRISEKDFIDIKTKSLEDGISYQTLIASIIHKYVSVKLVENYKL